MNKDSFYVAPPGGESIAHCCIRVDDVISKWRYDYGGQRILVVCHGNIMNSFMVRFEHMTQQQYKTKEKSKDPKDQILNCQIFHYTRRDPFTGEIYPSLSYVRSICPWDESRSSNTWKKIVAPTFTTSELLEEVNKVKQIVNNPGVTIHNKVKKAHVTINVVYPMTIIFLGPSTNFFKL